jgi:hypothetical protein
MWSENEIDFNNVLTLVIKDDNIISAADEAVCYLI